LKIEKYGEKKVVRQKCWIVEKDMRLESCLGLGFEA
jgi:hypothetical protein